MQFYLIPICCGRDTTCNAPQKDNVGLEQIMAGEYNGWRGWAKAVDDRSCWNWISAYQVAATRLFGWHLVKPATYLWAFYSYAAPLIPAQHDALFYLLCIVAVREATYTLLVLIALPTRPVFLLINLNANKNTRNLVSTWVLYIFAPEKIVYLCLMNLCTGRHGCYVTRFMFLLSIVFDTSAVMALVLGTINHKLPLTLVIHCMATVMCFICLVSA
jgi:hypothetical protein